MTALYAKNSVQVRRAVLEDCARLAAGLRRADADELRAACPHQDARACLTAFWRSSAPCYALVLRGELAALCGLVPVVPHKYACVWMLTSSAAGQQPKAFYRAVRFCAARALQRYAVLFNFADERYTAAQRLIAHLGGRTEEVFIRCGQTRFLLFTLRRKYMGALISTSSNGVSTALAAFKRDRRARRAYEAAAEEAARQAEQTALAGWREKEYLFESAAEKTRRLYRQAQEQAAADAANFAADGLTPSSASVDTLLKQNRLQAQLEHARLQDAFQAQLGAQTQAVEEEVRALREQSVRYGALSKRKSTWSKLGETFSAWFH